MSGDGRNSDDADWLLAQLAAGGPARQDPPVAPPPAADLPAPIVPAAPPRPTTPAPRREEVLDWFSLAEPTSAPDAATRALPVIGGPPAAVVEPPAAAPVPPAAVPPAAPAPAAPFAVEPPAAPAGLPAWNPPFTVGRPAGVPPTSSEPPSSEPPSPLTSVEPPVGMVQPEPVVTPDPFVTPAPTWPVAAEPAASLPPAEPGASLPPQEPSAVEPLAPESAAPPQTPPGPVTPTAQFALTWGGGDLDSEDALRAAFRSLSEPAPQPESGSIVSSASRSAEPEPAAAPPEPSAAPPAPTWAEQAPPSQRESEPAQSAWPAFEHVEPAAEAAAEPTSRVEEPAPADSPFAGFTPPPVARASFTPAPGMAVPPAEEPPAAPVVPPRHPIVPTTAPASWDERAARPAPAAQAPVQPEPAAFSPEPAAFPPEPAAFAPEPAPFAPERPAFTRPEPAAFSPEAAASAPEPAPEPAGGGRFGAFASDTFASDPADPFRALLEASEQRTAEPASSPAVSGTPVASEPSTPSLVPPTDVSEATTPRGFPFLEVRGEAEDSPAESAGDQPEYAANRRAPFPAFASAGGDRGGRDQEPQRGEPVDDLLAALGSGASRPTRDDEGDRTGASEDRGAGAPPERGGPPSGGDEGLGALGLSFGDDGDDGEDAEDDDELAGADTVPTSGRGRFFGRGRSADEAADDRDADVRSTDDGSAPEPQPESPIARELAETGYFWNLTPDPSAADPKTDDAAEVPETPAPVAEADWDEPEAPASTPAAPEPAEYEPFAPPIAPATFTAALFTQEPAARPEPEPSPEPSWSFGGDDDGTADELAGYHEDAPTAMFPEAPAAGAAAASSAADAENDDPLAALFGGRPAPGQLEPLQDPWETGSPFGSSATTSAPADRYAADADPFAAYAAAGAAPAPAPAAPVPAAPRTPTTPAPRTGGTGGSGGGTGTGSSEGTGGNRTVRTLIWVAGGLVAALVLVGLFFLGTQLSGGGGGEASGPSTSPTATETPEAAPTAPQPAGVHPWNTLFGGECIDPFESAWAEEFTVVDCAAPHAAQLVFRGLLPGDTAAPFPGEAEIASQMNLLCTAPGIIDVAAVSGIDDLQVQAAFPVTEEQWAAGERTYYCFANRAGGEPLTVGIAGPGPTA